MEVQHSLSSYLCVDLQLRKLKSGFLAAKCTTMFIRLLLPTPAAWCCAGGVQWVLSGVFLIKKCCLLLNMRLMKVVSVGIKRKMRRCAELRADIQSDPFHIVNINKKFDLCSLKLLVSSPSLNISVQLNSMD